jgi:acetyltransferase-like isoleucine patch superfamily enzyme
MSTGLSYKYFRLISELRRWLAIRRGRVTIDRRGFRLGRGCRLAASETGLIQIGEAVHLEERVLLQSEGRLEVGPWVYINRDVMIVALESIVIGFGTRIAERVSIRDHDHGFSRPGLPIREQGYVTAPIHIGRECWIGCNAVILKGVLIGDGAVVGAGAVVTRDIPARAVAVGIPARVIRFLEPDPAVHCPEKTSSNQWSQTR